MIDFAIGAGQGGCRIAKAFAEELEISDAYLNFARVDFSQLDVPTSRTMLIDAGGTGRDPETGESIARENRKDINDFLEARVPLQAGSRGVVCVGGGGGSGAGMVFTVIDHLLKKKVDVLLIYTLPERSEGLPAKPNALKTLNKLITKYLEEDKISVMVVDNSFCVERFGNFNGTGAAYWDSVNHGIVRGLMRYWYLTNLEQYTNYIDVTAGFGALDERELIRLMYMKGGFIDLRETSFASPDPEEAKTAKFRSLVFSNLDIASTKGYIVTVGFPSWMKNDPRVPDFLDELFKKLARITKTSFVLRSSHYNSEIDKIRVNVLLAGMTKSHGLKKMINQTKKDVQKYKEKERISELDLSEIEM